MRRNVLDITNIISRRVNTAYLTPYDLSNSEYSIWLAKGWRLADILREVEYRTSQVRVKIRINTHYINAKDFVVEQSGEGILIKFIKSHFEYKLDTGDEIILTGDIENYA